MKRPLSEGGNQLLRRHQELDPKQITSPARMTGCRGLDKVTDDVLISCIKKRPIAGRDGSTGFLAFANRRLVRFAISVRHSPHLKPPHLQKQNIDTSRKTLNRLIKGSDHGATAPNSIFDCASVDESFLKSFSPSVIGSFEFGARVYLLESYNAPAAVRTTGSLEYLSLSYRSRRVFERR